MHRHGLAAARAALRAKPTAEAEVRAMQRIPSKKRRDPARKESRTVLLFRPLRLARALDVDPSTIWRWRKSGVLKAPVEIGGVRGWTQQYVESLLADREAE
ncbi:MAG: hypothetical protein ACM3TN_19075 [Alphaproteobacteria bacterium]